MKPIVCLMGPTTAGKTAIAIQLAQQFPIEIISVDSAMIYREMNIGTAKPTAEELALAPHHLIDIIDPSDIFSVAQFCQKTEKICEQIYSNHHLPVLVGGTMMYFQALQQGLAVLPEANLAIRQQLNEQAIENGWPAMHHLLTQIDPVSANKIHPNDTQRLQRALEVFYISNQPLSSFFDNLSPILPFQCINLLLMPSQRNWLHQRIEKRFDLMIKQGFVEEVEQLLDKWQLSLQSPAMRCVGYRQAGDFILKKDTYEQFRNKTIAATRQLAKRQLTWLRHWSKGFIINCDEEDCITKIIAQVQEVIDNNA